MAQSGNRHGQEAPEADITRLSQPRQELLGVLEELYRDFHPEPGVLADLPQIAVDAASIVDACRLAKDDPRLEFKLLLCLGCVDYQDHFQMVYVLQSLAHEQTLVIKTDLPYEDPKLPSVTSVWRAAEWYEREAHDLFGVEFEGHPGLTPLLLYEGFEGYPGRKEYKFYDYEEF